MRATNQGGSLVGFIIIGVLLALVLIGGLYGLNRYNAQRAADETVSQEENKTKTDTPAKSSDTPDKTKTEEAPKKETDRSRTNDTTPAPAPTPAPVAAPSGTQLPQTGPADVIFSLVATSALAFAGVHYARSRSRA